MKQEDLSSLNNDEIVLKQKIRKIEEFGKNDDAPTPVFSIWWFGEEAKTSPVDSSVLALQLYNHRSEAARVQLSVTFTGLLTEPTSMALGEFLVDGKQEMLVEIPAEDIPLQTTDNVCTASAYAELTYEGDIGVWKTRTGSDTIFYQHNSGYKNLRFFQRKVFQKEFGGTYVNHAPFGEHASGMKNVFGRSLGRKKLKNKGGTLTGAEPVFEDVTVQQKDDGPVLIGISSGPAVVDDALIEEAIKSQEKSGSSDSEDVVEGAENELF